MGLKEFLQWLIGSGGSVIALSWLFERWSWFQSKASNFKEWFFFGVVSAVWCAAYAVVNYVPAGVIEAIQPWFLGVSGLFVVVVVGRLFHKADKM
jgi:hypothetical protein